jgi:hypothetical protein
MALSTGLFAATAPNACNGSSHPTLIDEAAAQHISMKSDFY